MFSHLLVVVILCLVASVYSYDQLTGVHSSTCRKHKTHVVALHTRANVHPHMLVDEYHRILVDWTPKAACTKVVEMFWKEMNILRGTNYPEDAFVHDYRHDFMIKCGTVTQDMLENNSPYYRFKVVRNPFYRAVSSYIHIMKWRLWMPVGKQENNPERDTHSPWADLSFEDFLSTFLSQVRSNVPNFLHNNGALIHFVSQSSDDEVEMFRNENKKPMFNRIVHLENFDEDIALVNKDTGRNYSYPEGFDSHVVLKQEQADQYVGNLSYSHMVSTHGIPKDYGKFYNRECKQMVEDIFYNDLYLYDYRFPFNRLY